MWRCPYCGTPQAETARCWVCHRSSTTCSTCRHFRRSVAANVGFCGLDRRLSLAGDEIRGCWELGAAHGPQIGAATAPGIEAPGAVHRGFVPVEAASRRSSRDEAPGDPEGDPGVVSYPSVVLDDAAAWSDRASLFGDEV